MDELLAQRFEENRVRLRAVALRMLGTSGEADDAVQEAWLRLTRADHASIDNLSGWLTTVVGRVCLDLLRARKARREDVPEVDDGPSTLEALPDPADAERELLLADAIGPALTVVLESLAPAERLAFVLHDLFAVPFDEIAAISGRTPASTRQLAHRARKRIQGASERARAEGTTPDDRAQRRALVHAFVTAARAGDLSGLLAVLDPAVVLRSDAAAQKLGASPELRGAQVAGPVFATKSRAARLALVDGLPGAVGSHAGRPRVVFLFGFVGERIASVELVADPDRIRSMDLVILEP